MNNLMKSNKIKQIFAAVVITLVGQNALAGNAEMRRTDMRQTNFDVMELMQTYKLVPRLGTDFLMSFTNYPDADSIAMPNIRVRLFIDRIRNEVIANGGVETYSDGVPISDVELITGAWEADMENGWNGSNLPSPGQTLHLNPDPNGIGMFEALVFGACESLTSFDMFHNATISKSGQGEIGRFKGVDTTTIDSTGNYLVGYTIHATDDNGGVSDFHFRGHLQVECSANNDLQ